MTLATRVRIVTPLPPEQVFHKCRELLGADTSHPWTQEPSRSDPRVRWHANHVGIGLPAMLHVSWSPDGPLPSGDPEATEPAPPACVEVWIDTVYGYRDELGGCEALHRRLTAELGEWLDDRGADWWAQDEYSQTWHHRTPCPVGVHSSWV